MTKQKPLKGFISWYFETGMEGSYFIFQDIEHIDNLSKENESWSWSGTHILKHGDKLKVFDKENPEKLLWEGSIDFKWYQNYRKGYHYSDRKLRALPKGVEEKDWVKWTTEDYPAELIPGINSCKK